MSTTPINLQLVQSDGTTYSRVYHIKTNTSLVEGLLDGNLIDRNILPAASTGARGIVKLTADYKPISPVNNIALTQKGAFDLHEELTAELGALSAIVDNLSSPIDYVASFEVEWNDVDVTSQAILNNLINAEIADIEVTKDAGLAVLINNVGNLEWTTSAKTTAKVDTSGHWLWIKDGNSDWFPSINYPELPEASTIKKGIMKFATYEDAEAGYSGSAAMTPATTKTAISKFGSIPVGALDYVNNLASAKVKGSLAFVYTDEVEQGTLNVSNITYEISDGGDVWKGKPGVDDISTPIFEIGSFDVFDKKIIFSKISFTITARESVDGLWLPPGGRSDIPVHFHIGEGTLYAYPGVVMDSSPTGWHANVLWRNVEVYFSDAEWDTFWSTGT